MSAKHAPTWTGPSREVMWRNRRDEWRRLGVCCPDWSSGMATMYHGCVVRVGLRIGPIGFYLLAFVGRTGHVPTDPWDAP